MNGKSIDNSITVRKSNPDSEKVQSIEPEKEDIRERREEWRMRVKLFLHPMIPI